MIREIRALLYEQGFTIGGARQKMDNEKSGADTNVSFEVVIDQMINELESVLVLLNK